MLAKYADQKKKYSRDSDIAQDDAKKQDEMAEHVEGKALRYDFGEGLLEIGLVLTSLYFISRSKLSGRLKRRSSSLHWHDTFTT